MSDIGVILGTRQWKEGAGLRGLWTKVNTIKQTNKAQCLCYRRTLGSLYGEGMGLRWPNKWNTEYQTGFPASDKSPDGIPSVSIPCTRFQYFVVFFVWTIRCGMEWTSVLETFRIRGPLTVDKRCSRRKPIEKSGELLKSPLKRIDSSHRERRFALALGNSSTLDLPFWNGVDGE